MKKKQNKIVGYLLDAHQDIDLNHLWKLVDRGLFTNDEMKEFYYLIGSSQELIDEIEVFDPPK